MQMMFTTKRLNVLDCVLRFALGRNPTRAERVKFHRVMFG